MLPRANGWRLTLVPTSQPVCPTSKGAVGAAEPAEKDKMHMSPSDIAKEGICSVCLCVFVPHTSLSHTSEKLFFLFLESKRAEIRHLLIYH